MEQYRNQPEIMPGVPELPDGVNAPARKPFWGAGATIGLALVIFFISSMAQVLVLLAFAVADVIANPEIDPLRLAEGLTSNGLLFAIATISSAIVGIGFIALFIAIRKGTSITDYLGLRAISRKHILVILLICFGLVGLSWLVNSLIEPGQDAEFTIEAYRTSVWPFLFWIAAVVFAPAFEESFFRGFLFVGLRWSRLGAAGTVALTSLTWALLHIQYSIYGMTTILILGIILGIVRLRTNSLWGPLIIHAGWNLVAMIGTAILVSGAG